MTSAIWGWCLFLFPDRKGGG